MIYERADSPFLSPPHSSGGAKKKLVFSVRVINIEPQPLLQSLAYQSTSSKARVQLIDDTLETLKAVNKVSKLVEKNTAARSYLP
jgi:hypothetical protein